MFSALLLSNLAMNWFAISSLHFFYLIKYRCFSDKDMNFTVHWTEKPELSCSCECFQTWVVDITYEMFLCLLLKSFIVWSECLVIEVVSFVLGEEKDRFGLWRRKCWTNGFDISESLRRWLSCTWVSFNTLSSTFFRCNFKNLHLRRVCFFF